MNKIVIHERIKREGAALVTGLPGIGLVGKIAADYMVQKLKPVKVATLYSMAFPPEVVTYEKGLVRLLRNEFWYYEDAETPFFILTGDVQPVLGTPLGTEHYRYALSILRFVRKLGVKEVYTMAGINRAEERLVKRPGVVIAANDPEIIERFKEKKIRVKLNEGGTITGAAGLLVGLGKLYGMKGASIMGETSIQMTHGDPGAARAVLNVVRKYLGFEIDMKDMEESAKQLDEMIKKVLSAFSKMIEQQGEEKGKETYIR